MENKQPHAAEQPALKKENEPIKNDEGAQEEFFDSLQQFYKPEKKPNNADENPKSDEPVLENVIEENEKNEGNIKKDDAVKQEEVVVNKSEVKEGLEAGNKAKEKKVKKSMGAMEENPSFILKTGFQMALDKLTSVATKETGVKEGKGLISRNNQPENLKVFINLMKEPRVGGSASEKDGEIVLLTYLLIVYKDALIEGLKNNNNCLKTPFDKIFEMLKRYFKEPDHLVQDSCSAAVVNIYTECLLDCPINVKIQVMFESFLDKIISDGGDRVSKATACKAYSDLLQIILSKHFDKDIFNSIGKRLIAIFLKLSPEYVEVLSAVNTILMHSDLKTILSGKTNSLVEKLLSYVSAFKENSKNAVLTKAKVEGMLILGNLATLLNDHPELLNEIKVMDQIFQILKENFKDKRLPINSAANTAIQKWSSLLMTHKPEAMNQLKNMEETVQNPVDYRSDEEKKEKYTAELAKLKNLKEMRERMKLQKQEELKIKKEEILSKEVEDIAPNVAPQTRAKNFTKKRTGTGGGSTEGKSGKSSSTENQLRMLKQMIKNSIDKRPKTANSREQDQKIKESSQRPQTASAQVTNKIKNINIVNTNIRGSSPVPMNEKVSASAVMNGRGNNTVNPEEYDILEEEEALKGNLSVPDQKREGDKVKKDPSKISANGVRRKDSESQKRMDSEAFSEEFFNLEEEKKAPKRTGSELLKRSEKLMAQQKSKKTSERTIEREEESSVKSSSTRYKAKGYRQKSNESKEKIMEDRVFSSENNDIGYSELMTGGIKYEDHRLKPSFNNTIKEELDPLNEESIRNAYSYKHSNNREIALSKLNEPRQDFQYEELDYPYENYGQSNTIPTEKDSSKLQEIKKNTRPGEDEEFYYGNQSNLLNYQMNPSNIKNRSDGFNPSIVVYKEENESQNNFFKRGNGSFINPPQNIAAIRSRINEKDKSSLNFDEFFESAISADASKFENGGSFKIHDNDLSHEKGQNNKNIKILNTEEAIMEFESDIKFPNSVSKRSESDSLQPNFRIKKVQPKPVNKNLVIKKKPSEEEPKANAVSLDVWEETLRLLELKDLNGAFVNVLQSDDDLYLLRLIARTGRCFKSLTVETAKETSVRLCKIMNSNFLTVISFKFLEEGVTKGLMKNLSVEDLESVEDILKSAIKSNKGGAVSKRAQTISDSMKGKKEI